MKINNQTPDLMFSYKIKSAKDIKLSENLSTYIIYGNILNNLEENICIGNFTVTGSLTNVENVKTFNDNYVCILPEGTITWFASGSNDIQNNGFYNPDKVHVSKIVHGTGDFTYSSGFVYTSVLSGLDRNVSIYFDK